MFDMSLTERIAAATGGGLSLLTACWIVLQALKGEMPWLRRYLVRIVVLMALAFVLTALLWPVVFAVLAGTVVVSALILGTNEVIKRLAQKPPDRPAT